MKESKAGIYIGAFLAGIAISLGGMIFLSVENKVIGSLLFSIGLFAVCTGGLNLYTGKICFVPQAAKVNRGKNAFDLVDTALNLTIIWIGNLFGTYLSALVVKQTRMSIAKAAVSLCETKASDNLLSLFILGMLCNIFIFIAVWGYKNIPDSGKYLAIIFGVMGFILCGTEHCVADMFYISVASAWSPDFILRILFITAGNTVGGLLMGFLFELKH